MMPRGRLHAARADCGGIPGWQMRKCCSGTVAGACLVTVLRVGWWRGADR